MHNHVSPSASQKLENDLEQFEIKHCQTEGFHGKDRKLNVSNIDKLIENIDADDISGIGKDLTSEIDPKLSISHMLYIEDPYQNGPNQNENVPFPTPTMMQ